MTCFVLFLFLLLSIFMNIFISFLLYFPPSNSSDDNSSSPFGADFCLGSCSGALDNSSAPIIGTGCADVVADGAGVEVAGAVAASGFGNVGADATDGVGDAGDGVGDDDEEKILLSFDVYTESAYFSIALSASATLSAKIHLQVTHDLAGRGSKYFFWLSQRIFFLQNVSGSKGAPHALPHIAKNWFCL